MRLCVALCPLLDLERSQTVVVAVNQAVAKEPYVGLVAPGAVILGGEDDWEPICFEDRVQMRSERWKVLVEESEVAQEGR